MSANYLLYLFLAYGVFALVPLALLIVLLVRLDRLTKEVAALRQRVEAGEQGREAAWKSDREGA